jgi:dipeptidyl aminopeptidase/acylaminoacyl peptidase
MSDTREILRRGLGEYEEPIDGYERVLGLRDRRRRNQRIRAGIVAAVIVALGSYGFLRALGPESRSPMEPGPSPVSDIPSNGAVAFSAVSVSDEAVEPLRATPMDIYLSAPGLEPRRILGAAGDGLNQSCPAFSPDGMRLAYTEGDEPGGASTGATTRALVVELDAEGIPSAEPVEILANTSGTITSCPKWSPDGSRIAVMQDGHVMTIVTPGAGSSTIPFGNVAQMPAEFEWSPDGTSLAALDSDGVWIVPADGSPAPIPLFREPRSARTWLFGVAWSPDGQRVAVGGAIDSPEGCCEGRPFLEIVSVQDGSIEEVPLDRAVVGSAVTDVAWLASAGLIVSGDELAVVDPGSASTTVLEAEYRPASTIQWSQDEDWFLYVALRDPFAVIAERIDGVGPPITFSPGLSLNSSIASISWRPATP